MELFKENEFNETIDKIKALMEGQLFRYDKQCEFKKISEETAKEKLNGKEQSEKNEYHCPICKAEMERIAYSRWEDEWFTEDLCVNCKLFLHVNH